MFGSSLVRTRAAPCLPPGARPLAAPALAPRSLARELPRAPSPTPASCAYLTTPLKVPREPGHPQRHHPRLRAFRYLLLPLYRSSSPRRRRSSAPIGVRASRARSPSAGDSPAPSTRSSPRRSIRRPGSLRRASRRSRADLDAEHPLPGPVDVAQVQQQRRLVEGHPDSGPEGDRQRLLEPRLSLSSARPAGGERDQDPRDEVVDVAAADADVAERPPAAADAGGRDPHQREAADEPVEHVEEHGLAARASPRSPRPRP